MTSIGKESKEREIKKRIKSSLLFTEVDKNVTARTADDLQEATTAEARKKKQK